MKGAKKERKMLEKSFISYLGAECREFESRHSDQKAHNGFCRYGPFVFVVRDSNN